jgi:hypothetical protein
MGVVELLVIVLAMVVSEVYDDEAEAVVDDDIVIFG